MLCFGKSHSQILVTNFHRHLKNQVNPPPQKKKKNLQQRPNCLRKQVWQGKESNQAAFFTTMSKNPIRRAFSNFQHKS